MITVADREQIRRAYFLEGKSVRRIAREYHHSRATVEKALASAEPGVYTLQAPRPALVLGPYQARIAELLAENDRLPRKQRYTAHKIYQILCSEGFPGAESTVRGYVSRCRREQRRPPVYLPLEFDPGQDAQVDWGEALAIIAGESVTVQVFYMRLCYSRRLFMMAFPTQRQEAFLEGHVQAFHFFQGVPRRIAYDNLKAAVLRILTGRNRQEQQAFQVFRSHYLFESRFCTPGQGHEKGGVEHGVGFGRRNFLVPIPRVASFAELNDHLGAQCLADDQRQVEGQPLTIGEAWARERPALLALPDHDFACCRTKTVSLTPYGQVEFETNRYSVPANRARARLVLRAYPLRIDILDQQEVIASHPRCYGRHQDIFDPLHYLPLLEQRPGAFEHAKPLRQWRTHWPPVYEELLAHLQAQQPDGLGLREFIRILRLHQDHPADQIAQAITLALGYGCPHLDGVTLCLRQVQDGPSGPPTRPVDLSHQPQLAHIGTQPLDLHCYDQLLE